MRMTNRSARAVTNSFGRSDYRPRVARRDVATREASAGVAQAFLRVRNRCARWRVAVVVFGLTAGMSACMGSAGTVGRPGTSITSTAARYTVSLDASTALRRGTNDVMLHAHSVAGGPCVLVSFRATMPLHGHTAYPTSIEAMGDGMFVAHALDLTMAGDWNLELGLSAGGPTADDMATVPVYVE